MQDYIINKIQENKLHLSKPHNFKDLDDMKYRGTNAGIQVMSYFMFKLAYDKDGRYGNEFV